MRALPYLPYLKDLYTWVTDIFFISNEVIDDIFKVLVKKQKYTGNNLKEAPRNREKGKWANFNLKYYFVEGHCIRAGK